MARRRSSLSSIIFVLAAVVIVMVGIHLAAPLLNPILFALVLSLLFSPLYTWLKRVGTPTSLALIAMLVGLVLIFGLLFGLMSLSVARLTTNLGGYASDLEVRMGDLETFLQQYGIRSPNLQTLFNRKSFPEAA
jgi:AI-2 transport protein TqsA